MNSKTIIDFFKVQSTNVSCPACGLSLPKCKLNFHLDSDCPSSSSSCKEKVVCSEIPPSSSKTSKPVDIKLKSKKNSKTPKSFKRSPKMNSAKVGRLSLKQQRLKNSNKITSAIGSLKCVKETEIITLDEDSSSSVDVTENHQVKNINVSLTIEQTNVKSTSAVTVHKESASCTEANPKLFNVTEINNLHEKEVEEKESLNGNKTSIEVNHDNVTKSVVNDISSKSGIVNESKSNPVCDVSIAISQNNADKLQSLGETKTDIDIINVLKDAEDCLEADDNVFTEKSETSEQTEKYSPYYIANFKHILNTVLNDDYNKILFNEEDMDYVKAFETSSGKLKL